MRNRRSVIVNLIDTGKVNNERLVEFFVGKIKERNVKE